MWGRGSRENHAMWQVWIVQKWKPFVVPRPWATEEQLWAFGRLRCHWVWTRMYFLALFSSREWKDAYHMWWEWLRTAGCITSFATRLTPNSTRTPTRYPEVWRKHILDTKRELIPEDTAKWVCHCPLCP